MKPIAILSCLLLASCGGDDTPAPISSGDTFYGTPTLNSPNVSTVPVNSYGSGSVPSSLNPFSSGHFCPSPVLSGSPEQKACFEAAQAKCPEGFSPSNTEFEQQADGQFLIKGYGCT